AAGFVGGWLRAALTDRLPEARRLAAVLPAELAKMEDWEVAACDLCEPAGVADLVGGARPDLIIHLAAQASVMDAARSAESAWRVNFGASYNLASAVARHAPGAAFLYASTSEVYGANLADGPANEMTALAPLNVYARSKAAAEAMLADVLGADQRLIICRPFNHTGPGQDERFVIPAFAAQLARIEAGRQAPVMQVGALSDRLDFLDVRDVVEAYLRLIALDGPLRLTVNIASGAVIEIGEAVEILRGVARTPFEVRVDPARLRGRQARNSVGDASKLESLTGWRPVHPISETIVEVLEAYRAREARISRSQA
ncbi:MAG: NAD-dependent epimerase/dehydratase family protein, partial [Caulobacteraceae bacterium]